MRRLRAIARLAGAVLVVAGVVAIAWSLTVWRWQDPVTAGYTWWQQRQLSTDYAAAVDSYEPQGAVAQARAEQMPLAAVARAYRRESAAGAAISRIRVPRLGLRAIVVNGTDSAVLKRGPGLHPQTHMPGEGELVYIAGHRTTFGAPFARIDALRNGDRVTLDMPYGTFTYRIERHSIVDATNLSVLRSRGVEEIALQACHPRFFATQRYIAWGRLVSVELPASLRGRVTLPRSLT